MQTRLYKGKRYEMVWQGETRTGHHRTLLRFKDSDKTFWVDSDKVSHSQSGLIGWNELKAIASKQRR